MLFVAYIYNNSLGSCQEVSSSDEGVTLIKTLVKEKLGRDLTIDEIEQIDNHHEYYNDDDSDNIFTYSIGVIG